MSRYRRHSGLFPIVVSLRSIREYRGIARKALAHAIGCGHFTLIKWENGTCLPSLQALHDWCQALGVDLIIDDEPADPLTGQERDHDRYLHNGRRPRGTPGRRPRSTC